VKKGILGGSPSGLPGGNPFWGLLQNGFVRVRNLDLPPPPQQYVKMNAPKQAKTTWSPEDWRQIAVCYVRAIDPKVAHELFPHMKLGSIRMKYKEFLYIDSNGTRGLHGNESSRRRCRDVLQQVRA